MGISSDTVATNLNGILAINIGLTNIGTMFVSQIFRPATRDPQPATRDPRPATATAHDSRPFFLTVIGQEHYLLPFQVYLKKLSEVLSHPV